ncbi:MAG: ribosome maturation factor RimP [Clostridiaceae bacterium]|mgnify:CR=1 FL=1|nr:ribosome maturation factor RimP [Clostridiaceae bacterium]
MSKKSIPELVATLAEPIVEDAGCELVDVEYVKEGTNWFLRVYIDKPGGVTLDDCENVSRPLDKVLDEQDFIKNAYYLEVSSPGLERKLKKPRDFERALGSLVEIRLYKAVDNRKRFEGELISFDGDSLVIRTEDDEEHHFKVEDIAKAKTIVKF